MPGDRFSPWGLKGTRKLKKVLIDMKVPLGVRRKLPLVLKGEEIMWIPGIRRGQTAPVNQQTRRVLQVSFVRGFPPIHANTGFHSDSRYELGNQPFGLGTFFFSTPLKFQR
jgi:tRNA(Ile)-lysidine synthetase-like protein